MKTKAFLFLFDVVKLLGVMIIMILMIGFAKIAQHTSIETFGILFGFEISSLLALVPIIGIYYALATKLPRITMFGRIYG